jgi:hypothetical protein
VAGQGSSIKNKSLEYRFEILGRISRNDVHSLAGHFGGRQFHNFILVSCLASNDYSEYRFSFGHLIGYD